MSIGSRIKECREKLGLTQTELAKMLDVSKGTIGNYEAEISTPKIELMTKLFEVLQTDANYIFQDDFCRTPETFSLKESDIIDKYRFLDEFGKDAVNRILEAEYHRCTEQIILKKWLALDEEKRQKVYDFMVDIVHEYESESVQSTAQNQSETIQRNDTYGFSEQAIARSSESNYKPAPTEEQYSEFIDLPDDMLGE